MTLWAEKPIDLDIEEDSSIKGELSSLILTISITGLVVITVVLVIVVIIVRKKQGMKAVHSRLTTRDTSSTEPVISGIYFIIISGDVKILTDLLADFLQRNKSNKLHLPLFHFSPPSSKTQLQIQLFSMFLLKFPIPRK